MKKRICIILLTSILLVVVLVIGFSAFFGRRPYKDLNAAQIASVTVHLIPPNETVQITEIEEFTAYLKDIVIYNKDNSYTDYSGQSIIFTLTMTDGTQTNVRAYNPFFVIDGVGYKTKYEPCEALSNYANRLLEP
ncbi:MAG: hypothetical protein NC433_00255 [Clostridiales bacterium]|nr:hypothetical protein [Clostridiales bacterium]